MPGPSTQPCWSHGLPQSPQAPHHHPPWCSGGRRAPPRAAASIPRRAPRSEPRQRGQAAKGVRGGRSGSTSAHGGLQDPAPRHPQLKPVCLSTPDDGSVTHGGWVVKPKTPLPVHTSSHPSAFTGSGIFGLHGKAPSSRAGVHPLSMASPSCGSGAGFYTMATQQNARCKRVRKVCWGFLS